MKGLSGPLKMGGKECAKGGGNSWGLCEPAAPFSTVVQEHFQRREKTV